MEEVAIEIEKGKVLVVRLWGISKAPEKGICRVFFELNGQPRTVNIDLIDGVKQIDSKPKFDKKNPQHVGSPMPGKVIEIHITEGKKINIGDPLITIEAMKMETLLRADRKGIIQKILISIGDTLDAQDLILTIK